MEEPKKKKKKIKRLQLLYIIYRYRFYQKYMDIDYVESFSEKKKKKNYVQSLEAGAYCLPCSLYKQELEEMNPLWCHRELSSQYPT